MRSKAKVKCKCCKEKLDKKQESGKLGLNEVDNQFEQQLFIIDVKGDSTMSLTKDRIKDTIFALECERDELQSLLDTMRYSGWVDFGDATIQELQETNCWIEYNKQLLKDIEQGEKYDE